MGGGVGAVGEVVGLRGVPELIADDAGLDSGSLAIGIELDDVVEVLGVVEDDGDVGRLAARGGPAAAGEHGSPVLAAGGDARDHVVGVARDHDPDRYRPVHREVVGIHGPRTGVEADLAANRSAQRALQAGDVNGGGYVASMTGAAGVVWRDRPYPDPQWASTP